MLTVNKTVPRQPNKYSPHPQKYFNGKNAVQYSVDLSSFPDISVFTILHSLFGNGQQNNTQMSVSWFYVQRQLKGTD